MASNTTGAPRWHTVVSTPLGKLTVVRDGEALCGLYFPHHWYLPSPVTFGHRRDDGFGDVVAQLGELSLIHI